MRRSHVEDDIYLDEAEGFLLEHSLFSPPRSWRPLLPESSQVDRVAHGKRKMDWSAEVSAHPETTNGNAGPSSAELSAEKGIQGPGRRASHGALGAVEHDVDGERCVICLMGLRDRTIVGTCGHEFCFECIGVWSNQSRRCPLCSADMAPFLLHDLDNSSPTKFYLPPLPQRKLPSMSLPRLPGLPRLDTPTEKAGDAEKRELDELDLQVERRRDIYRYGLYAKHIASNTLTSFRPNPTPREISDSPILTQRAAAFMRRELRVWGLADVEFLTNHVLSLIKAVDIRSEPAIRLLSEFLDHQAQSSSAGAETFPHAAEHFAHELYSFLRSPFKELWRYDEVAQYDPIPSEDKPPPEVEEKRQEDGHRVPTSPRPPSRLSYRSLRSASRARSQSGSSSRSSSFSSISRSPSPRSPRQWDERDTYIPPSVDSERRWDQPDTWLDPEYEAWLEDEKKRAYERDLRRRAKRATLSVSQAKIGPNGNAGRGMRAWDEPVRAPIELLPSSEIEGWEGVMVVDVLDGQADTQKSTKRPGLSIRGSAEDAAQRRSSLRERLEKAKAEAEARSRLPIVGSPIDLQQPQPPSPTLPDPASLLPPAAATALALKSPGVRAIVLARLRLRLKLAAERQTLTFNTNESRAQELRRRISENKAARMAAEKDADLRELDKEDRKRELRRRLAVAMMRQAETEGEKRERELREKAVGSKRARLLKEKLRARKASLGMGTGGGMAVTEPPEEAAKVQVEA